jgi:hypothetical protein
MEKTYRKRAKKKAKEERDIPFLSLLRQKYRPPRRAAVTNIPGGVRKAPIVL